LTGRKRTGKRGFLKGGVMQKLSKRKKKGWGKNRWGKAVFDSNKLGKKEKTGQERR